MLRVGLSGGIGSGKSTVAARLVQHGAVLIDADKLAREVVEPGSVGLAELVDRFGPDIVTADGSLDRPALAKKVFGDDRARADLNAITHPKIGALTAERMAQAPADAVVVHDVPLLVENGYAANYHLVLIVDAPEPLRVQRLVERGLDAEDARARIRSQATDEQRREAADVWLDNSGPLEDVVAAVDELWSQRLVPFERNVREGLAAPLPGPRAAEHDPEWPRAARRIGERIRSAAGERAVRVDHVGPTAVAGLPADGVLDLQLGVRSPEDVDALAAALAEAGFPAAAPSRAGERLHRAADPQRPVTLHIRAVDSPGFRQALLLRDWLSADPGAREEYLAAERQRAERFADDPDGHTAAAEEWFAEVVPRAEEWASRTGWTLPG